VTAQGEGTELIRSIYAAWEQGDWSKSDWADPEIEFVIADGPDPRSFVGRPAMAAGWREFLGAWAGYGVQADEYRELADGRVLVVLHALGRGRLSGVEIEPTSKGANIFRIRDGKVVHLAIYFDHVRALEDIGLDS
jgi:ketosteroid isomerase-like protein